MRFGLDEDREALRATARELLAEFCPASAVRAAWTQDPDRAAWNALAEAGALAVLVPPSEGGLGLDETYLVPVIEEAGRAALPHPLTETALVAAPLGIVGPIVATDLGAVPLAAAGEQVAAPTKAADKQVAAPTKATSEGAAPTKATSEGAAPTKATSEGAAPTKATSEGAARAVIPSAAFAEAFLLASGGGLRLYEAHEVEIEPVETVDASRHCARVRPRANGVLVADSPPAVAAAFDRGVLGTAAELVGLSRAMLELTVGYAAQRHQFGKPIGSFQAVKHHLAGARIQIEFAAPAVLYAAYAVARGLPDASRSVSQAKWLAGAAATTTGRAALQCHGAIGYTTEYDLHLYLKRSWALARSWGGAGFHADRVAASIGL